MLWFVLRGVSGRGYGRWSGIRGVWSVVCGRSWRWTGGNGSGKGYVGREQVVVGNKVSLL